MVCYQDRARHSTRSLSRVYSRSMMLLLGNSEPLLACSSTTDAAPSTRSTRWPPPDRLLSSTASALGGTRTGRTPAAGLRHRSPTRDRGEAHACSVVFGGFLRYPPPKIVGRLCMCALDGRALDRALGCPPRVLFLCAFACNLGGGLCASRYACLLTLSCS